MRQQEEDSFSLSLSSIQAFSLCIKIQEKTLLHVYQCIVPSTDFYYCYKLFFPFLFNLSLFYRLLGVRNSIIMATLLSRRRERYIIVRMQVCLAVDHNEQYSRPLLERKKSFSFFTRREMSVHNSLPPSSLLS